LDAGEGQPLLLVHGFPLDHTMWRAQIDYFAGLCRVIAPDLRGFGGSDGAGDKTSMELFADDLARLLERLDVRWPAAFCGLSMGGYIAWQFLRRHPQRLERLILCDTRAAADSPEAAQARRESAARVLQKGAAVVAEAMAPKLLSDETRRRRPAVAAAVDRTMRAANPQGLAAALRGMAEREDATSLLGTIDIPTLVLCGEEDAISPVAEMRGLAQAIPGARFVEIPAAGHLAPLENPQPVNEAIRQHLQL
jgi:pimeloyl-ACP methyl ester carboxylesterase